MTSMGIDFLAFTGHKELQGPPGIGGLIIADTVDIAPIEPLVCGGTGSRSESEEQPEDMPDKFESGTPNLIGIAGLRAGIQWVKKREESLREHQKELTKSLVEGLAAIPQVTVYGTHNANTSIAVVSFTAAGKRVSEIGLRLDEDYSILCRVGLHCAPAAHRTIGTFPEGTIRLAPGVFTSRKDIATTIRAIKEMVRS
jgi:cysteine desulfurase/selenocysteine lyase